MRIIGAAIHFVLGAPAHRSLLLPPRPRADRADRPLQIADLPRRPRQRKPAKLMKRTLESSPDEGHYAGSMPVLLDSRAAPASAVQAVSSVLLDPVSAQTRWLPNAAHVVRSSLASCVVRLRPISCSEKPQYSGLDDASYSLSGSDGRGFAAFMASSPNHTPNR